MCSAWFVRHGRLAVALAALLISGARGAEPATVRAAELPADSVIRAGLPAAAGVTGPALAGEPLQKAIRAALLRAAQVKGAPEEKTVRELVHLYQSLEQDACLADLPRQALRRGLRGQLRRLGEMLQRRPGAVVNAARPFGPAGGVLGQVLGPAGAGQARTPPADYGQDLVELIQAVLFQNTWDTVGGSGSIRYWAPGHALIVRQTADVHEAIGQLLQDLR